MIKMIILVKKEQNDPFLAKSGPQIKQGSEIDRSSWTCFQGELLVPEKSQIYPGPFFYLLPPFYQNDPNCLEIFPQNPPN